jgi:hypothetical protein
MKIRKIMPFIFAIVFQYVAVLLFIDSHIFLGIMIQFIATILSIATGILMTEE